jgi:amidase
MAGPDPRAPLALGDPGASFARPAGHRADADSGLRVAWSAPTWAARFVVDHQVAAVVDRRRRRRIARAGARVHGAQRPTWPSPRRLLPDAARLALPGEASARLLAEHPDGFKPSLAANIRAGESLTGADVAAGLRPAHRRSAETMRLFFADHDLLVLPTSRRSRRSRSTRSTPPHHQRPGAHGPDYLGVDALGLLHHRHRLPRDLRPCRQGVPPTACPSAIQIVAPHGADRRLLESAAAFETMARACPSGLDH